MHPIITKKELAIHPHLCYGRHRKFILIDTHMKSMSCAQMGGECDAVVTGNTPEEMMNAGMEHLHASHPEMAAQVMATPKDDPKMVEWNQKFMADFEALPEME